MGLFAKSQSGRRRTKRFDLEAAAKGQPRGVLSLFRADRFFDVAIAAGLIALETALFVVGVERLDAFQITAIGAVVLGANLAVGIYVSIHHKDLLGDRRQVLLLHGMTLGALALARVFFATDWPALLFPLGIFSIALSVAHGQHLAAIWTLAVAGLIGLMRGIEAFGSVDVAGIPRAREIALDFPLAATLAMGTLFGIFSLPKVTRRRKVIQAGIVSGAGYALATIALGYLLKGREFILAEIDTHPRELGFEIGFCLLNGLFTGYFMVEIGLRFVESAFDVLTDLRLQELASLDQPILKKFAIEAPGTFHHSQMVGTLAEAAAEAVGANPLLCRVGAHFHDIGKMNKPEYYIENVQGGATKHEGLTPTMSTLIITSHVKDGIEIAEELGLPPRVIDCIPEHHGTIAVEYFYHEALKQQKESGGPEASKDDFRYPGPKPQSKETAILMIADSVEAISRVLTDPTPARIEQMVHDVVMRRLNEGQLDECGITLRELKDVERAMSRVLLGFFHGRIKYPKAATLPSVRREEPAPAAAAKDGETSRVRLAALLADGPGTPSAAAAPDAGAGDDAGQPAPASARAEVGEKSS
jgi:putative nucleotidyltransferase with HDIG domain